MKYIDVTRTTEKIFRCRRNILKITGTLMEKKNCRMHGEVSRDSLYLIEWEATWWIFTVTNGGLPYLCERPIKNPSIWKESLTWIVPWIRSVREVNLDGWYNGCRHWWAGKDGRIGNLCKKTQCKGSNISQWKWNIHIPGRRWTNKICWRRSETENIHLDMGPPNSRKKSKRFSWRIRRVSTSTTSRLTSGCQWCTKWFLVRFRKLHKPPSRWIQSQTSLAERRIIPYSTEIHWRLQNYEYKLGCYARMPHRWLLEYRWIKRFVWFLDKFHPVSSIKWEASRRPELWRGMSKNAELREKHKWAIEKPKLDNARRLRGIYYIDPEDIELKEIIKNARRKLETPMAPAVPCKTCKKSKHGETRSKTNDFKSKFACILEASDSTRMPMEESLPKYHDVGKGDNSLQHYNLVHNFSYASSNEDARSKSSSGKRMGETWKYSSVGQNKSEAKEGDRWKH